MDTYSVTIQLPERLYRSAYQLAQTTKRPIADILRESLNHTLPPLDDVPPEEAEALAQLSLFSDTDLWHVAQSNLSPEKQEALESLLMMQNMGELDKNGQKHLADLQDEYGRLLVRQSHAWLLLARRGYKVPLQSN